MTVDVSYIPVAPFATTMSLTTIKHLKHSQGLSICVLKDPDPDIVKHLVNYYNQIVPWQAPQVVKQNKSPETIHVYLVGLLVLYWYLSFVINRIRAVA